jgi:hypothetical protein
MATSKVWRVVAVAWFLGATLCGGISAVKIYSYLVYITNEPSALILVTSHNYGMAINQTEQPLHFNFYGVGINGLW